MVDYLSVNSLNTCYVVIFAGGSEDSGVGGLPATAGVEGGSVQNHTAINYIGDDGFEFFKVTFPMKKKFSHKYLQGSFKCDSGGS